MRSATAGPTNHLLTHDFDNLEEKKAAMERWKTQLKQLHIEWPIQMKIKEEKLDEQDGQGLPMPGGLLKEWMPIWLRRTRRPMRSS